MKSEVPLTPESERAVHKYADLLLRRASAYGRFPTPVDDLVKASKLEIARESVLAKVGLAGIYRRLPNFVKLTPDTVKSATAKLLGLLDRREGKIHLAEEMHPKRRIYVTVHELGHEILPHQREMFQVLEESELEIDPDTKDLFEQEANFFASDVLFQRDGFTKEAADHALGIRAPIDLAKKYGPSIYASARRYVERHHLPCALVVFELPVYSESGQRTMELRRVITSALFQKQFNVSWPQQCDESHFFLRHCPTKGFLRPTPANIQDINGDSQPCLVEAFNSSHNVLYLLYPAMFGAAMSI
jgi:Zn-dependent peptidase ImmA (M78 family)